MRAKVLQISVAKVAVLPLLAAERAAAAMSFGKAGFGGKVVDLAGMQRTAGREVERCVSGM